MSLLVQIYKLAPTILTFKDLVLLSPQVSPINLKRRINYYVKSGQLLNPAPGIYAKENYDPMELGNRIYTPSYVSFETVLAREGLIFQYYDTIFYASYLTRDKTVADHKFSYKRLPGFVLTNKQGVEQKNALAIATKERAFLDAVYVYKDYHMDNLDSLNKEKVFEFMTIYDSKIMLRRVKNYYGA